MSHKNVSELNHYEILNLCVEVSPVDIERAYMNTISIYGRDSVVTYNALNENERKWMIDRINQAYEVLINPQMRNAYDLQDLGISAEKLKEMRSKAQPTAPLPEKRTHTTVVKMAQNRFADRNNGMEIKEKFQSRRLGGEDLKNIRIAKGASLEQISDITKVKKAYLEAIEQENINNFPAPIFMKGFLKAYARALGLDPEEISAQYMGKK